MMSASEGGGGSWKSGRSKGGCVNFIVQTSCQARTRGEGVKKSENFADVIDGWPQRGEGETHLERFDIINGSNFLRGAGPPFTFATTHDDLGPLCARHLQRGSSQKNDSDEYGYVVHVVSKRVNVCSC